MTLLFMHHRMLHRSLGNCRCCVMWHQHHCICCYGSSNNYRGMTNAYRVSIPTVSLIRRTHACWTTSCWHKLNGVGRGMSYRHCRLPFVVSIERRRSHHQPYHTSLHFSLANVYSSRSTIHAPLNACYTNDRPFVGQTRDIEDRSSYGWLHAVCRLVECSLRHLLIACCLSLGSICSSGSNSGLLPTIINWELKIGSHNLMYSSIETVHIIHEIIALGLTNQ